MLLFVAFYAASLTQAGLARPEAQDIPNALGAIVAHALRRGRLRTSVDADQAALVLTLLIPALGQAVVGGALTTAEALATADYELDRIFAGPRPKAGGRAVRGPGGRRPRAWRRRGRGGSPPCGGRQTAGPRSRHR